VNSHDGSSAYTLYAAMLRLACPNGLLVGDATIASISVRHTGTVLDEVKARINSSARRGTLLSPSRRDTAKKMSGHLTDDVFSRYNIVAVDDLRDAAEKIEQSATQMRASATKSAVEGEEPAAAARMLQ
jgi:hypothetical protein